MGFNQLPIAPNEIKQPTDHSGDIENDGLFGKRVRPDTYSRNERERAANENRHDGPAVGCQKRWEKKPAIIAIVAVGRNECGERTLANVYEF